MTYILWLVVAINPLDMEPISRGHDDLHACLVAAEQYKHSYPGAATYCTWKGGEERPS